MLIVPRKSLYKTKKNLPTFLFYYIIIRRFPVLQKLFCKIYLCMQNTLFSTSTGFPGVDNLQFLPTSPFLLPIIFSFPFDKQREIEGGMLP